MDPAALFFVILLLVQASFTGTIMWLVARRFPRRLPVYRFVAPAGVPLTMFVLVATSFLAGYDQYRAVNKARFDPAMLSPLGLIFLAYAVLWLIGVVIASAVIRWTRR